MGACATKDPFRQPSKNSVAPATPGKKSVTRVNTSSDLSIAGNCAGDTRFSVVHAKKRMRFEEGTKDFHLDHSWDFSLSELGNEVYNIVEKHQNSDNPLPKILDEAEKAGHTLMTHNTITAPCVDKYTTRTASCRLVYGHVFILKKLPAV